jgi:hypothetical protein
VLADDLEALHPGVAGSREKLGERGQEGVAELIAAHLRLALRARDRDREMLPVAEPALAGAVEQPLDGRVNAGGEGEIGHLPVVDDVQVHDRGGPESREARRLVQRPLGKHARRAGVRERDDHAVGFQGLVGAHDGEPAARGSLDPLGPPSGPDLDAGRAEGPRAGLAVDRREGQAGVADVAGRRVVQQARLENERRHRQRGPARVQVERRQSDQVPERLDRVRRLSVSAQPIAERARVQARVREVEPGQLEGGAGGAQALPDGEVAVASQSAREVERRRERGSAQPLHPASGGDHGDLEAGLERGGGCGAEPLEQGAVRGAAAKEDVLPVVENHAVALEGVRGSAEPWADLDQRHLGAGVRARQSRGDPRQAAPDHRDAPHAPTPERLRAATHAFSQGGSDTRRRRTCSGSRSIWPRMRR